jgi:TPR repeat protein
LRFLSTFKSEFGGRTPKATEKRVKANDPAALKEMGVTCYGEGDWDTAFEYWTKAVELGDAGAHYNLGCMYALGEGVEMDEEKKVYHYEKAAISGHPKLDTISLVY